MVHLSRSSLSRYYVILPRKDMPYEFFSVVIAVSDKSIYGLVPMFSQGIM